MYSILPFIVILIENVILAFLTMKHARKMKRSFASSTMRSLTNFVPPTTSGTYNNSDPTSVSLIDLNNNKSTYRKYFDRISRIFDKRQRFYRKSVNIQEIEQEKEENFVKNFTDVLIKQAKRNKRQQTKGSQVANLLLFLTVSFVIATVPYSTFYALKVNLDMDSKFKNIVINILSLLQYLRHAANFLIYLSTSSIIKNEIKLLYKELIKTIRNKFK